MTETISLMLSNVKFNLTLWYTSSILAMFAYILLFILTIILMLLICILASLIFTTIFGGIPYLPTNHQRIKDMLMLAKIKKGEKAVDLGSGDGRIVIAMAKQGAEAHGYELNFFYVLLSNWNIKKQGLEKKAFIHWGNFFTVDLSSYDVITCYGISYLIQKIEKKLKNEIKTSARVIATSYKFRTWKYSKKRDFAFLYKKITD